MSTALVTVGAAGFGRELLDVVLAINQAAPEPVWSVLGVLDDAPSAADLARIARRRIAHLGAVDRWLAASSPVHFAVGIGNPRIRRRMAARFASHGHRPATLCHPAATIGFGTIVAPGSVVCAGAQVSTEARLGTHAHINPNATIGHDASLGDFVSVNPGAVVSGACELEEECLIGAGAVILQGLRVGRRSTVGAAACVTRDVLADAVVKGVPAR